ncbi:MAG: hypothetical protein WDN09_00425 [bacterium]
MDGFATWLAIFLTYDGSRADDPVEVIFTMVEPVAGAVMARENCPMGVPFLSFRLCTYGPLPVVPSL